MNRAPSSVISAGLAGGSIGALGGAAITSSLGSGWVPGAVIGALFLGSVSALADATRMPGKPQPSYLRIASAAFLAAVVGAFLEWLLPDWSAVPACAIVGLVTGLVGLRVTKALLGLTTGVLIGGAFSVIWPDVGWAIPSAITVVAYRSIATVVWRNREQIRIVGEGVSAESLPFVVAFTEPSKYVGVDYLERYARSVGAAYVHDPHDIGIVGAFDDLAGPTFDPSLVDPLVREFYEHTTRFSLTIVPEWKRRMRIPYRVFRATIAEPFGQVNAPFDQREVLSGVVSWIDTIDVDHDGIPDARAWVRAYDNGDPIYVGIYTIQRIDGTAYVSVGFPLPAGNFTATLLPTNHRGSGLLLGSESTQPYSGHYLSSMQGRDDVTTVQLTSFGEQIDVFVDEGALRTEHRFSLNGSVFMTLHYTIERKVRRAHTT